MATQDRFLKIGSLVFDGLDQIDLTGPFEVLSQIPDSSYEIYAPSSAPVRDIHGLVLTPDRSLEHASELDVLHVPGGPGQEALMHDQRVLTWLRAQASGARHVLSVCTGALLLGAAGLLVGRRATTHWTALHLLPFFGAEAINQRVVIDGNWVFTGGVTAGIDGALTLAAQLRGREVAEGIQLAMQYAPEPPFDSGTLETAPAHVLQQIRADGRELSERRRHTAEQIGHERGLVASSATTPCPGGGPL